MKKGSRLFSILFQKCPRCQEGDLFIEKNPYKLDKLFKMPHACEKCGQVYQLEPSFFYGAMYVNYALSVAIGVAVFVAMIMLGSGWSLEAYLLGILITLLLTAPFTFRLGRSIWINFFIKFNPEIAAKVNQGNTHFNPGALDSKIRRTP